MHKNFIVLVVITMLALTGCGAENNNASEPHASSKTHTQSSGNSGIAATPSQPTEPEFNLEQVQQAYRNTQLTVLDISERSREGRNSIAITLSVPLDPSQDHQSFFNISAKNQGAVDGAWIVSKSGKTVWFPFVEPDSAYDITIYEGLVAANGQRLAMTKNARIKTSQLAPSVNFDTTGAFLTQGLGNGLPIVSVNVKQVDINFYRVKEKSREPFLQEMSSRRAYWGIERVTQFADLAYTGRYDLNIPDNTRVERSIDIEGVSELELPGIYLAIMNEAGAYNKHQMMWFSVTDIGLHARFYETQLDVYASSLKTGKALAQVNISLVNNKGEILQQSLTSPNGQVSFTSNLTSAALIVAQNEQHFSVIEINKPALDLSDFNIGLRPNKPQQLFIYAPRDLYRPGELVHFNALLRNDDGRLTTSSVLKAAIKSPDGTKVKTFNWNSNTQNFYQYQWHIPASAPVGAWQLEVKSVAGKTFTYQFKVEEFLPERLKLTFNPKNPQEITVMTDQKALKVPVMGEYLFGAPAAGNRLSTEVSISQWRNPIKSLPTFEFGDIQQTRFNKRLALKDIQLDQEGIGELVYQGNWSQLHSPQLHSPLRVKFISSLYESGGRPVSRTYSGLVWPSEKMLGIRTSFGDVNPPAHSTVSFEIIKASLDGVKHSANDLDIKLIREDRRYFWVYSDHQGWHYEWNDNEYVELTASLDINHDEVGRVEFPVTWGNYRLEVRDTNHNLKTSTRFYAGWNWYEDWQNSQAGSGAARPDKVTMALDKAAFNASDTAKVTIVPPQAGEAVILVEGDAPLWMKRLHIPAEGAVVEIPISADWQQHNIYISAVVLQAGNKVKALTPKRSFGLIHLPLQREQRKLNVQFDVADKALPNKTLPVKVMVNSADRDAEANTKAQGDTSLPAAFVTLAAVDVGVLNISDFNTPDPFNAFFGQRRYEVDVRDIYNNVIEINQADKARLRFGGDSDLTRGGKAPLSDVQIVSLFSGLVPLNQNGEAIIPLNIPDFNGRLRLMAVAFTDEEFGHGDTEVTIAAPVVTQIAMPRFLAMGDETAIALDVTNLSEQRQDLFVKLNGAGAIAPLNHSQDITLEAGTKTTLHYNVKAEGHEGLATFSLLVSGDNLPENIDKSWHLGLRPAYPAVHTRLQKVLNQNESVTLEQSNISALLPNTIQASVAISPNANIDLKNQLTHLLQYPYGCLEQTSSRVYPLIFATPDKQKQFSTNLISEEKRQSMINKGIERLAMLQLGNGGYGLWSNTASEEHWLTTYIADFLVNARDMGVTVPDEMLAKTLQRLQRYLARTRSFYDERWSEDSKHYYFAYKAYAAYVLAAVNQAPLGALRSLAKNHSANARSGLSQLQLAIALFRMGDKKLGEKLLADALNNLPKKRDKFLGDYGSQIRDLALMIHLLLKHDLDEQGAIALSFTLAEQLNVREYLSTQERNALFLAGLSLAEIQSQPWSAEIIMGAASTKLNQTAAYHKTLNAEAIDNAINNTINNGINNGITITAKSEQPVLARISVNGYGTKPPAAVANGMSIQRHWLNLKGEEVNVQQAKVGELLLVNLQVRAEQITPDALVVDLLPAGFELENQHLDHAIKLDEIKVDGKTIQYWQQRNQVKHQEYRDDRYVAALTLLKGRNTHLFYLVRAVTPGKYKVPSALVEDMYRPEIRGVGKASPDIHVIQK
ncbi:alpha-2-macroglobulin family protein [Flocculibacter collagenilyticus]|uniref:alpha-2-macroglobulin family protein n=1 Tax=Flocculibacter collagenilyticus TaxID=2744479 RepID=UPI0018F76334|nr:alpha-2-macroglobulin [Flocculibacter collagenilyticus]